MTMAQLLVHKGFAFSNSSRKMGDRNTKGNIYVRHKVNIVCTSIVATGQTRRKRQKQRLFQNSNKMHRANSQTNGFLVSCKPPFKDSQDSYDRPDLPDLPSSYEEYEPPEPLLSFKDDWDVKPKFVTNSFSEEYEREELPVQEREDRERLPKLSPGIAIFSGFTCVVYSRLAYMGTLKVLEVLEGAGARHLDIEKAPIAAARSVTEQMVVAAGFLLVFLFLLYAFGLFVYAGVRVAQRNQPTVYYRCDGKDPKCCEGSKPHFSYLSNMRGYETDRRKYMDRHLTRRPGCSEVEPVVIKDEPFSFW